MANKRSQFETVETFIARFTLSGVPVTDAVGIAYIYRVSNGEYWDGDAGTPAWVTARTSVAMTKISDTNQPGDWKYAFDNSVGLSVDEYIVEVVDSAVAKSDNTIERMELSVGGYLDQIEDDLRRVLALQHDNFVMDPLTYDDKGSMLTGVVRAYDSAANTTLDNGVTGLNYTYAITGERTVEGYLGKYTQTRTL